MTGARGFLGRHLVAELLARGHEVTGVLLPSKAPSVDWGHQGVRALPLDLRRPGDELGGALARADVVFHLAARTEGTWRSMFDATVLATQNLARAMEDSGWRGRLVHVSSFSVYGLNQVPSGSVIDEASPLEPQPQRRDHYAWTKWLQERLVRDLRARDRIEVTIVRPGVIHGRGREFQHQLGREVGSTLLLLGGRVTMRLNYVENTASLLAACAADPRAAGEVFNAVDPQPISQWQYLRAWRRLGDAPAHVVPVPLAPIRLVGEALVVGRRATDGRIAPPRFLDPYLVTPSLRDFRYDTGKPARVLGWQPPISRAEALGRTFATR